MLRDHLSCINSELGCLKFGSISMKSRSTILAKIQHLFRDPRFYALILPFILLAPIWATGKALYWGTPATQFVPWWVQAWEALLNGELPLWNPLLGAGTPLLANYQSALLYPGTWVYFLLYRLGGAPWMAWGIAPMVALHLSIAIGGMLVFLRKLGVARFAQTIGALAFGLSGYLFTRAHFLSINVALAWLPWILVAAHELIQENSRRAHLKLAAFLALQWLAGHAQTAWYSLGLLVFWVFYWVLVEGKGAQLREKLLGLAKGMAIAGGVTAVQLLPTLEFLSQSQRATQVDPELALTYSLWPWRLITLLAPKFFGSPVDGNFWGYGNFWEDAIYIGLIPLLLATIWAFNSLVKSRGRRKSLFLGFVILVSLLLALGKNTPIFPWLFSHVTSFSMFQAPTRFSLWAVFSLAVLAAFGAENWRAPERRSLYWMRLSVAGAVAVLFVGFLAEPFLEANGFLIEATFMPALQSEGFTFLAFSLLSLTAPKFGKKTHMSPWHWTALLVAALELSWLAVGFHPAVERDFYARSSNSGQLGTLDAGSRIYMDAELEDRLRYQDFFRFDSFISNRAVDEIRQTNLPNTNILNGVPSLNNYDPLQLGTYVEFVDILEEVPEETRNRILENIAVGKRLLLTDAGGIGFENLAALPIYQWFNCPKLVIDNLEARNAMLTNTYARRELVVEAPQLLQAGACFDEGEASANIQVTANRSNKLTLQIDAGSTGWLFMAITDAKGWNALLDGEPTSIYPADIAFQAVIVSGGEHILELSYRPVSFRIGALISFVTLGYFAYDFAARRRQ